MMQLQVFSTHTHTHSPVCVPGDFPKVKKAIQQHQCDIRESGRENWPRGTREERLISGEERQLFDGLMFWSIMGFFFVFFSVGVMKTENGNISATKSHQFSGRN